jgi:hypothetical protein
MNCHRIKRSGKPAGRLHSLVCAECRASRGTDDLLAFGIVQLRKSPVAHAALNSTLAALQLRPLAEDYERQRRMQRKTRLHRAAAVSVALGICGWFGYMDWLPAELPTPASQQRASDPAALDAAYRGMHVHFLQPVTSGSNASKLRMAVLGDPNFQSYEDKWIATFEDHPEIRAGVEVDSLGQFVAANKNALSVLHSVLTVPYRQEVVHSVKQQHQEADQRALLAAVTLLHADALWKAARGDRNGTLAEALNLIDFGENIAGAGSLPARLLGWKCQNSGRMLLWRLLPSLSSAEALAACRRLEAEQKRRAPLYETIQWERASGVAMRRDILSTPFWRWKYASNFVDTSINPLPGFEHVRIAVGLYGFSNRHFIEDYLAFMDAVEKECRAPLRPDDEKVLALAFPQNYIDQIFLPVYSNIHFRDLHNDTEIALLTTALAIQAYYKQHNANPQTLKALCPQYLAQVPADPFQPAAPLHYAEYRSRSPWVDDSPYLIGRAPLPNFLLYSVGPDGKDQNGSAISRQDRLQDKFQVLPESVGDIVAGINR